MPKHVLFCSCALIAALPAAALAQGGGTNPAAPAAPANGPAASEEAQAAGSGLSEIVVTAQRRTENLQKVPIAATALSGDQLKEKAVARLSDLQSAAPALSITDAGLTQSVNIRGIGIASGSPAVANGVAVYINGVFQPPILTTSSFYDIGNVEVLRGPQGTLVGSNSTGGAIFINSQAPSLTDLGGYAQTGYGNYDNRTLQGALNVPLTGNLAVRAAGNYEKRDSYYRDIGTYHNKPGSLDEKAGRLSLLWTPGDLRVTSHVEFADKQTGGYAYQPRPGSAYEAGGSADPFILHYDAPTLNHEREVLSDLEARYQFASGITLRYLGGYINKRITNRYDLDATALPPGQTENQFVRERETVQEVNLISPTNGRLNWIVGGYYQRNLINVKIDQSDGTPVDPTRIVINDHKVTTGVFGQVGYKITDRIELQVGARYSHYKVAQTGFVAIGYGTIFGPDGLVVADLGSSHKDGRLTGKANINFQLDQNNLIYAFAARGYKPGGANSVTSQFTPETVLDYEVGWKSSMLDNHLRTQIGAYYMDYQHFQFDVIDVIDVTSGQTGVVNLPKSSIYGAEAQIQGKFGGFGFDASMAYVHSKLGKMIAVNQRLVPAGVPLLPQCDTGVTTGCTDYAPYLQPAGGGTNLLSPRWSYNFGVDYQLALGDGIGLTPRVNYAYVGKQWANLFYAPQYDLIQSRGLVSAMVTLHYKQWSLEGYATNLTNKRYVTGFFGNTEFFGAPREYGIRASIRF